MSGWTTFYNKSYGHYITQTDIDPGAKTTWLLVCAGAAGSNRLLLCAAAKREDALRRTSSSRTAYLSNGAYWYNYPTYSFGFTPSIDVNLVFGDILKLADNRLLSWYINRGPFGGFRVGIHHSLVYGTDLDGTDYNKLVYYLYC